MAKAYLESTDQTFTANNQNTTIYGQDGQQSIVISGGASNITLDQNIEEIVLQKASSDYAYKQTGNILKLYEANTLILSITVQGDSDGTKLIFSNGYAYATLQDSIMKLGGSTSSQTEDANIRVFDQNKVITPLTLKTTTPSNNQSSVASDTNFTLTFSESVFAESAKYITIKKTNDNSTITTIETTDPQITINGDTVTINPTNNLPTDSGYYILIDKGAFVSSSGSMYEGISSSGAFGFSTPVTYYPDPSPPPAPPADTTAPTLASSTPIDDATGVAQSANIVLTMSENVTAVTGKNITIKKTSDDSTVATIDAADAQVTGSGSSTITINPTITLGSNTGYYVLVDSGAFKDSANNVYAGISSTTALGFTTAVNPNVTLSTVATGTGGFAINGQAAGDYSGYSVSSAGDVNGDGLADLIVGAPYGSATASVAGRSYIVFGKNSDTNAVSLSTIAAGTGGFAINGEAAGDTSGYSVSSAGDVSGDGLADLIVGAEGNDTTGSYAGRSYVVFGKSDGAVVSLATIAAGTGGFAINGEAWNNQSGRSVSSAGDVNGDGLADLIVGAYGNSSYAGRSYVVFGKSDGSVVSLATIAAGTGGFAINGEAASDNSGYSVSSAGDVNGDGLADLIVGAYGNSSYAGRSYIIFGGSQWLTESISGTGAINGTAASEAVIGSSSSDTLTGGGGIDRFYSGDGADVIVLTSSDITNLSDNTTGSPKATVDGGGDIDALRLSNGANLDLTAIANQGASGVEENSRIESIERIDLATDTAANTLTLTIKDVIDISGMNLFNSSNGWTGLAASVSKHQIIIEGGATDTLTINEGPGTFTNTGTATYGGNTYNVYENATSNAQIIVLDVVGVVNSDV